MCVCPMIDQKIPRRGRSVDARGEDGSGAARIDAYAETRTGGGNIETCPFAPL